jgi:HEAT repeat protein
MADTAAVLAALAHGNDDERFSAARAAAEIPESVDALRAALARETNAAVREALFSALVRIGSPASVEAVLPYLRSDDALLRTEATDALAAMKEAATDSIAALLRDADPDVRILACTLVRNLPSEIAAPLCCELLDAEQHQNVCAAAVEALAELGHAPALPALSRCAERFRGTPFLEFAIRIAIDRIRSQAPNSRA